ncbi:sulfurtransferase [uncultured Roseobacter sp.]|uniref:sulfurtransferase n=1 Tax=uncultured Roseobacter sp. TaxID=114847 RepID=UPI00261B3B91|nr:sulfurtransferase [uncultured Roseobacter sp.]
MTTDMSRRTFAALMAALTVAPGPSWARDDTYANPHLLESAEGLLNRIQLSTLENDGVVLIDVRERQDFNAGHIPGARHLDPNAVVAEDAPVTGALRPMDALADMLSNLGISPAMRVVFYDDRGGFHAARMFWLLEYLGHANVAVLNGGMGAWRAAEGPIASATRRQDPATLTPSPMPRRIASADYILSHRHDPETMVVDVRPPDAYAKGHIPWARNIPWSENLGEDGLFLPAEALRAHFEGQGVTPDRNIVIHCQVGLASSHSYVALRLLGYPRVRVYHRSWAEWGADTSLPAETGA